VRHTLVEWNADEVSVLKVSGLISDYREAAEWMAEALQSDVEKDLEGGASIDAEPEGDPLEEEIDHSLQTGRSEDRFREWEAARRDGVALMETVMDGGVTVNTCTLTL